MFVVPPYYCYFSLFQFTHCASGTTLVDEHSSSSSSISITIIIISSSSNNDNEKNSHHVRVVLVRAEEVEGVDECRHVVVEPLQLQVVHALLRLQHDAEERHEQQQDG